MNRTTDNIIADSISQTETISGHRLDPDIRTILLEAQRAEITEHVIYLKLAHSIRDEHNRAILTRIAADELEHYQFWKRLTGEDVAPDRLKIWKYVLISKVLGLTFGIKLMENEEIQAQTTYHRIADVFPSAKAIVEAEDEHEHQLIGMIHEEKLKYIGSVVLGLNDALVELTGALAGLTYALQNTRLIAAVGFITGIAASLSMAASEYLSTKSEETEQSPLKASFYTGVAYILTVLFLILPYVILDNAYMCLGWTLFNAILVIFVFNYYVSVAKDIAFRRRFLEMGLLSLSIAALTFCIGIALRKFLNLDI